MELREIPVPDAELFLRRHLKPGFKTVLGSRFAIGLTVNGQLNGVIVVGDPIDRQPGDLEGKQAVHHLHIRDVPDNGRIETALMFYALQIFAREKGIPQLGIPLIMEQNVEQVR